MKKKVKKEIQITQYILSLIAGSFFVITNALLGWGTYDAQIIAIPPFVIYNIMDIFLAKYWKTDKLLLIHHIFVILLGSYIYFLDGFSHDIYMISYYISLGEISTIFNCLRWFYYGTTWEYRSKIAFASAFLICRPISNIGLLKSLREIKNPTSSKIIGVATTIYTFLNIYWGKLIIKKLYNHISS